MDFRKELGNRDGMQLGKLSLINRVIMGDKSGKIQYEREINVMKSSFDFECASFGQFALSS